MAPRATSLPGDGIPQSSVYNPEFLRDQVRWIRDDLDPQVAREGGNALRADDILKLDEFLRRLLISNLSKGDILYSRLHLAVSDIAGRATRWPDRLVDRCDALKASWEASYGPLHQLGVLLYEPGGRLHNVCKADDLSKEKLIIKWIKAPGVRLSPMNAARFGDLGFKPGDWWISPLFAFRDGMVDSASADGIVADARGAYAVLMAGDEEIAASSASEFVYRSRPDDKGRYRLAAGTPESRNAVRILRSHTLRSFYAPKAGLRYDGLIVCSALNKVFGRHKVTGWSIKLDPSSKAMVYDISFKRLSNQPSMDSVLCRPWVEEIEDYKEYKRLRQVAREKQASAANPTRNENLPVLPISGDAAVDVFEDKTADTPIGATSPVTEGASIAARRDAVAAAQVPQLVPESPSRRNALGDATSLQQNVEAMGLSGLQVERLLGGWNSQS